MLNNIELISPPPENNVLTNALNIQVINFRYFKKKTLKLDQTWYEHHVYGSIRMWKNSTF